MFLLPQVLTSSATCCSASEPTECLAPKEFQQLRVSANLYFYDLVIALELSSRAAQSVELWQPTGETARVFFRAFDFFRQSNKRESESIGSTVVSRRRSRRRFMWVNHLGGCQDFVGPPLCAADGTSRYWRITDRSLEGAGTKSQGQGFASVWHQTKGFSRNTKIPHRCWLLPPHPVNSSFISYLVLILN